jgi:flagellar biosynthetic protein FliQ
MNPEDAIDFSREAMKTCMLVGGPILVTSLLVGLVIGIIQTKTQVQEQTVSFVPKILVLLAVIGLCLPWLTERMTDFARLSFEKPMTQWSKSPPPSLFASAPVIKTESDSNNVTTDTIATKKANDPKPDKSIFSLIGQFQKFERSMQQPTESDSQPPTAASNNPFSLPHYRISEIPRTEKGG